MSRVIKELWADVKANRDFVFIETLSGNGLYFSDPKGKKFYLPHTATDDELGESVGSIGC